MIELLTLFISSVLISLVTFGGGAQALFYQIAVQQQHWISAQDLTAVLAFGFATPGPAVFGSATFIGYHVSGLAGALIGAIGIFMVPCIGAIVATRYFGKLLLHRHATLTIQAIGLAVAGLVAASAFGISNILSLSLLHYVIFVGAFIVSVRGKMNPFIILLIGGLIGLL